MTAELVTLGRKLQIWSVTAIVFFGSAFSQKNRFDFFNLSTNAGANVNIASALQNWQRPTIDNAYTPNGPCPPPLDYPVF